MKGLGTALITPFKKDGSIDYEALDRLLDKQLAAPVDYLVVLGTTGEPATMTLDERRSVLEAVLKKVNGRLPIVLGLGGNCTARVLEDIEVFKPYFSLPSGEGRGGASVSAILSVCPYYNKPSQEGLYRHFTTIAKACPVPVILYNVPGRTGVNLLPETAMRIYESVPNNIMGIKEASGNIEQIMHLIQLAKGKMAVISGDDNLAYQLMQAGANGLISVMSNAYPKEFATIVHEQKAYIQADFEELIGLCFKEGSPAGIKTMLADMGLIENEVRLPLAINSESVQAEIRTAMQNL